MGIYLGTTKLDVMPNMGERYFPRVKIKYSLSGIHAKNNIIYPDTRTWTMTSNGIVPTNYKDTENNKKAYAVNLQVTAVPTDLTNIFSGLRIPYINLASLDTSQVKIMKGMFFSCGYLSTLDVSHFNTSQVTDMSSMFGLCVNLSTLDVSHFDTSRVTNMQAMFGCGLNFFGGIISNINLKLLDVSNFNTSKVKNMKGMFEGLSGVTSLDVSRFDTSQVTDISAMFSYCFSLRSLDLSNFNTSKVTDMTNMFYSCSALEALDLSSFDTSAVTKMDKMFDGCVNLKTVYCRTQADADKLKTSSAAPATINFVVK